MIREKFRQGSAPVACAPAGKTSVRHKIMWLHSAAFCGRTGAPSGALRTFPHRVGRSKSVAKNAEQRIHVRVYAPRSFFGFIPTLPHPPWEITHIYANVFKFNATDIPKLGDQDSNLNKQNQNLLCYRYTIPQDGAWKSSITEGGEANDQRSKNNDQGGRRNARVKAPQAVA